MEKNTCRYCGKVFFNSIRMFTCKECQELDNKRFEDIEEYLRRFPNSNAVQIARGLGITPQDVLHYVDEGRLMPGRGKFEKI